MKDFETFYKELISNEIWFVPASMHHKPETFRSVANKVYMEYVGNENFPPIQVARVYVFNKLCKITPDKAKVDWTKKALEKAEGEKNKNTPDPNCPHCKGSGGVHVGENEYSACPCVEPWKPVSWEKRAEYLKMVQTEIDKIDNHKVRPLLNGEAEANGQYDLPKPKAKCAPSAPVDVVVEHINKVNAARRKFYLERNPNASEEEIQAYIEKFEIL